MYADDALLIYSHYDIHTLINILQNEFNIIVNLSSKNNLFINKIQTNVIHFKSLHADIAALKNL